MTGAVMMFTGGSATADPTPEPCVPSDAWTETTTQWATQPPDGRPWQVVDTRTVEDKAAYDEVVHVGWKNWVWHPTSDWVEPEDGLGPYFPDEVKEGGWWSSNEGNHDGHPQPGSPGVNERGNYYRSTNSQGIGDWFHWEELTTTVHHDAVTHEEHLYALVHPAVVCPEPTETPTTPTETPTTPTTQPTETTTPPEVLPTTGTTTPTPTEEEEETVEPAPAEETQPPEVLGEQAEVPTSVDAGVGWTGTQQLGAALAAVGLVLLVGAAATPRTVRGT
jgi:hypothetical protein